MYLLLQHALLFIHSIFWRKISISHFPSFWHLLLVKWRKKPVNIFFVTIPKFYSPWEKHVVPQWHLLLNFSCLLYDGTQPVLLYSWLSSNLLPARLDTRKTAKGYEYFIKKLSQLLLKNNVTVKLENIVI